MADTLHLLISKTLDLV